MNNLQIANNSKKILLVAAMLLSTIGTTLWAQQTPQVTKKVDTTAIKIGEQINYKVTITADSTAAITFPDDKSFTPMEMVDASKVDTIKNTDNYTWIRTYALSQFDSGQYYIPKQRILINNKPFYLDSVPNVSVAGVVVDTTKQPMFDIKPLVEVKEQADFNMGLLWWVLIPLVIIGFIVWWFVIRKKPLTEEEKIALLPPFDRAIKELNDLEKSRFILESNYKGYYSELTTIVKRYLEDEVHIAAMESTTDELFAKISMLQEKGNVKLEPETIANFKRVLQTADLVKFARSKPQDNQVESDRKVIQGVVVETKESLPEPTEEELAETEAYREEFLKRRKRKRILIAIAASVLVIALSVAGVIWHYGFTYVKDSVLGHETKELLEGKWVTSEYGVPPVRIQTPEVLLRTELKLPEAIDTITDGKKMFEFGSIKNNSLYVSVTTVKFKQQPNGGESPNVLDAERNKFLEAQGAKNMMVKESEFTSKDGVTGKKSYGLVSFPGIEAEGGKDIEAEYALITFTGPSYEQAVLIVYRQDDVYSFGLVNKMETSIEVNIANQPNTSKEK